MNWGIFREISGALEPDGNNIAKIKGFQVEVEQNINFLSSVGVDKKCEQVLI